MKSTLGFQLLGGCSWDLILCGRQASEVTQTQKRVTISEPYSQRSVVADHLHSTERGQAHRSSNSNQRMRRFTMDKIIVVVFASENGAYDGMWALEDLN